MKYHMFFSILTVFLFGLTLTTGGLHLLNAVYSICFITATMLLVWSTYQVAKRKHKGTYIDQDDLPSGVYYRLVQRNDNLWIHVICRYDNESKLDVSNSYLWVYGILPHLSENTRFMFVPRDKVKVGDAEIPLPQIDDGVHHIFRNVAAT